MLEGFETPTVPSSNIWQQFNRNSGRIYVENMLGCFACKFMITWLRTALDTGRGDSGVENVWTTTVFTGQFSHPPPPPVTASTAADVLFLLLSI